jgi:hypothetical protein
MLLTLALVSVLPWLPFGHHATAAAPANPAQSHSRIAGWTLSVRRDPFVGSAVCQLYRGRASYERQALVLRLPPRTDTAAAVYRVDGGAPTPVFADRAAIASLGFALWRDQLDNPSGGLVRIPYAKLTAAHQVQLETRLRGRIWSFPLDGLPAAVAAEHSAGCA